MGENLFFWPSRNFGPKTGLNLSENLFFFGLHLSLGRKMDLVLGWKIFILVFIIFKFSEFLPPPLSKIQRTLLLPLFRPRPISEFTAQGRSQDFLGIWKLVRMGKKQKTSSTKHHVTFSGHIEGR